MNKHCKVCLVQAELDEDGRCRSCATALAATRAGMTYGKFVARYGCNPDAIAPPVRPRERVNAEVACAVCGEPIPPGTGRKRYCSSTCATQGHRQVAADYYRARHPAPPRLCIVCGRPLDPDLHKSITMCSDVCREARKNEQRRQRYIRAKERKQHE